MDCMASTGSRLHFKSLNDTIRYTCGWFFAAKPGWLGDDRSQAAQQARGMPRICAVT
ncbi:MAG: hypothetical protein V7646_709, partial [Pseudonocardia sp.]